MKKLVFITALILVLSAVYGQSGLFRTNCKSTQADNPKIVNGDITMEIPTYAAGTTVNLTFTYSHLTSDYEFTDGISLDFPAGVTVNAASALNLYYTYSEPNWNGQTGNGTLTSWGNIEGGSGLGPLRTTQDFNVNVTIDAEFTGDLDIIWLIVGDGYHLTDPPHSATGTITLTSALATDVKVVSATPSYSFSGETLYPEVTILNLGTAIATDFSVSVVINDGASDVYSSTKNITSPGLAPNTSETYSMTDLWSPADGAYSITASVTLTGDENNTNDELTYECLILNLDAYIGNAVTGKYLGVNLENGSTYERNVFDATVFPMAEEWDGTNTYRIYADSTYGTVSNKGIYSQVGTLSGVPGLPTGLAYDHTNEVMYVSLLFNSNISYLCTLDLATGVLTLVGLGDTGVRIIAIDFANDGYIYGPALNDKLYKINPATGQQTVIGSIGIDIDLGQDVSYDIQSNRLYTVTCGAAYKFGYYDITSGAFNSIADMSFEQYATVVIRRTPIGPLPISENPINMDTGVAIDAPVSASFNVNVFGADLTGISISPDPGSVSASIAENVVTITHDDFDYNKEYTVTIPNASINDGANDLDFDFMWSFTTNLDPTGCNAPENIMISNIDSYNATVSWTESGAGTEWVVAYGPVGFNPETDGETVTASTTTQIINNLTQLTFYEVYVKTNCDSETSAWANPVEFTTLHDCNAAISNLPYFTDFDYQEPCWTIDQTNVNETWKWEVMLGSTQYVCYYDDALGLQDEWLITPKFDFSEIADNIAVAFSWKGSYGYSVSPYDNYDMLFKVSTNGTEWTTLWDETEVGVFENLTVIYTTAVNVSAFAGESSVWFAFNYYGSNDAQWIITDFAVDFISSSDSKLEDISTISVFPNPANSIITISNAENENIVVLNMLGEVVANISNAGSNQTIDISNLSNGTYFVKVNSEVFKINVIK